EGFRTRVQLPPPPKNENPTKTKELQNQLEIAGFFIVFSPDTCYMVYQNPAVMGIFCGYEYTQKY
ncbi:MAG: hypothetical protein WCO53_15830, partial [Deltaproteobacteria bacterium]